MSYKGFKLTEGKQKGSKVTPDNPSPRPKFPPPKVVEMTEYDTWHTDNPICPYCGHECTDAYGYNLLDGETLVVECDGCEKEYKMTAYYNVDYTTEKVNEKDD